MAQHEPEDLKIFEGDSRAVERDARDWLRRAEGHMTVTGRVLALNNNYLVLMIFYRNNES